MRPVRAIIWLCCASLGLAAVAAAEAPAPVEVPSPIDAGVVSETILDAGTPENTDAGDVPVVDAPPPEPSLPDLVDTTAVAPPAVPDRIQRIPLTFVIAADLDGALAEPDCRAAPDRKRTLAHLAASSQLAVESALAEGRTVAASVYLGDFTGPAALGRWLIGRPDGPDRFAGLIARAGFSYLGLGNHWFDQEPSLLARFAPRLPALGIQLLGANVACEGREDCTVFESLPTALRLPVRDLDVRLTGVALESILLTIDPRIRNGLTIRAPAPALSTLAEKLRADGADLVIAATHLAAAVGGISPLASLLAEVRGVDLVIANHLGELAEAAATLQPENGTALAIAGDQRTSVLRLDVEAVIRTGVNGRKVTLTRLRAQRLAADEPDRALADDLEAISAEFCAAWDRPLVSAPSKSLDANGFRDLLLDTMRRAAEADVGLVNDGLFDPLPFPLPAPLSTVDVFRAIAWDDEVVRAEVPGSRLRDLWGRRRAGERTRRRIGFTGIVERDGKLFVNGRPLDDAAKYRLALNRFLSQGGDDLVGKPLEIEAIEHDGHPLHLRDALLDELGAASPPPNLDLLTRPRWTWSGGLTLSANDTRLGNEPANPDPRLKRTSATAVRGEATGRADVDATDHAGRITGRMRYAAAAVAEAPIAETEDQTFVEALYRLRAIRHALADAPWAPIPYVSGFLDAELVPAPSAAFRHFEAAGTVGLRLAPVAPFEFKAGASARRELFQPDARMKFGLELGYELPRFSPIKLNGLPVDVESNLDFFLSDIGGDNVQEGRLRARLMLPLGGPLSATAGVDLLVLKRADQPYAFLSDLTFGITARFDGARQTF